jgi:hypothetical protein
MIITHTTNAEGQRRIYLGGKSSMECWIAPAADGKGWTFHVAEAVGGFRLADEEKRETAVHVLRQLADALHVSPHELREVTFCTLASLHEDDPSLGRRVVSPRRRVIDNGFTAMPPGPKHDSKVGRGEHQQSARRWL